MSGSSSFSLLLDGYMGDHHGSGTSKDPSPQPASGEKKTPDGLSVPVSVPVAVVITNPLTLGLDLMDCAASKNVSAARKNASDPAGENAADSTANASYPPVAGSLAELASALDEFAGLPLAEGGRNTGAAPQDPASQAAAAPDAASDLAFSARLTVPAQASTPDYAAGTRVEAGEPGSALRASQSGTPAETDAEDTSTGSSGASRADAGSPPELESQTSTAAISPVSRTIAAALQHPPTDSTNDAPTGQANPAANVAAPVPAAPEGSNAPVQPPASAGPAAPIEPAAPPAQPASHDVSLHLGEGNNSVDIRMAERAGEIRVTVHTPDRDLAGSLRADLPDLVGKLRQSGYQAEAWRPASAAHTDSGRRDGSDSPSSQQDAASGRRDGRRQQQQQQKNQSRWDGEWNASLAPAQESQT